jgi:hypothetical protein
MREFIAGSMVVYGGLQGVYSALTLPSMGYSVGIFIGMAAIVGGGIIAEKRKKESKLVGKVDKE